MQLLSWLGGGLWIIPLITTIGTLWFGVLGYKSSKSGSGYNDQSTGKWVDTPGNIPFLKTGYGKFSVALGIATIVILILMFSDR